VFRGVRIAHHERFESLVGGGSHAVRHHVAAPAGHQHHLASIRRPLSLGSIAMRIVAMPMASMTRGLSFDSAANSPQRLECLGVLLNPGHQDGGVVPGHAREILVADAERCVTAADPAGRGRSP
jgi:hypothetical protein